MKKAILTALAMMSISATAFANEEARLCWFPFAGAGKDGGGHCRVRLDERNTPATPASPEERLRFSVHCGWFEIHDDRAVQFEKRRDEYTVGTDDGRIAALIIKDEDRGRHDNQRASLILSDRGRATRLEGHCKRNDNHD